MKTIASAVVFFALTATAWADEPEKKQVDAPANSNEFIVLSDAEMYGVTAGRTAGQATLWWAISDANTTSGGTGTQNDGLMLGDVWGYGTSLPGTNSTKIEKYTSQTLK